MFRIPNLLVCLDSERGRDFAEVHLKLVDQQRQDDDVTHGLVPGVGGDGALQGGELVEELPLDNHRDKGHSVHAFGSHCKRLSSQVKKLQDSLDVNGCRKQL